jgi:hypothetical protein
VDDEGGNPRDTEAPDERPVPEPERPPLDDPDPPAERPEDRLSRQVPIGILFIAATGAVLLFLALIGVLAYFALSPDG